MTSKGCSKDWRRYSSAKGTLLELIKGGVPIPRGSIIFEDPPEHDLHRALLTDVFKPRRIAALEPKVREYCARSLEPLVGKGGFDFVADIGAPVPMRTIGMLLGIPDQDQQAIRDRIDDSLKLKEGAPTDEMLARMAKNQSEVFAAYIDWRAKNPSDDIMTELLTAEFDDVDGKRRRLTRDEVLGYVNLLAAAGNETTTRLIGWAGKVLAEHPDQRRELAKNPRLIAGAIEELLRYESPSPVQARYVTEDVEHHGQPVKAGSVMLLLTGSANRDERRFPDGDRFDVHRPIERHVAFGYGVHFCLGAALARLEARIALEEVLKRFHGLGGRLGACPSGPYLDSARLGASPGHNSLNRERSTIDSSLRVLGSDAGGQDVVVRCIQLQKQAGVGSRRGDRDGRCRGRARSRCGR